MPLEPIERKYDLVRHAFSMKVSPHELFTPNMTTKLFTGVVQINHGDTVFDIGSGLGPLAIWAALEPSRHVYSVEIVKEQYELAKQNVKDQSLENKITLYNGNLFEPIPEGIRADVIIADVSGISEKIARIMSSGEEPWYPCNIPTGGKDGAEVICAVLEQAGNYLAPNGRLYYPVAGLSNHQRIEKLAAAKFHNIKEVEKKRFPLTAEQTEAVICHGLPGTYEIEKRPNGKGAWIGWIYEASNPQIS